ncbi:MAG: KTSC domain-containing protein, partial [Candidatus Dadabacteria bacterium]|nr:KTSC domain-containing protein [Candidatus Dadabacteria bacterium]
MLASTYNPELKRLTIIFKNGGRYTYLDVPNTEYFRFETAESQGKILNSNI